MDNQKYLFVVISTVLSFCVGPALQADAKSGIFANGMYWQKQEVVIRFNPALSKQLENPDKLKSPFPSIGEEKERQDSMQKAVDAWNAELAALGSKTKITLVINRKKNEWAGIQAKAECKDPDANELVYKVDYSRTAGDRRNNASTAQDNQSGQVLGPGWIQGGNPKSESIDKRLAETSLLPAPAVAAPGGIQEADIIWFTHVSEGERCPVIRWNYLSTPAPQPYYDYYSVMLHEVGHLLGLDHQSCPRKVPQGWINNVMLETISPGQRTEITDCERKALSLLYLPPPAGTPPPGTGTPPGTEGK